MTALPLRSDGHTPQYIVTPDGQGYTLDPSVIDPKGRQPRPWIQGGAGNDVAAIASASQPEAERRRELRRQSRSQEQ